MGFVIGQVRTVRRKVEFTLPHDDGKPKKLADIVATFRVISTDTLKARIDEQKQQVSSVAASLRDGHSITDTADLDEKYLREDLVKLEGVMDADGNELEFSPEVVDAVLNDLSARAALLKAHREAITPEAIKRKN